ncbi:MAG: FIG01000472: hypothetical protein, partial [uncultured Nocardioidaceae bacterium]
ATRPPADRGARRLLARATPVHGDDASGGRDAARRAHGSRARPRAARGVGDHLEDLAEGGEPPAAPHRRRVPGRRPAVVHARGSGRGPDRRGVGCRSSQPLRRALSPAAREPRPGGDPDPAELGHRQRL